MAFSLSYPQKLNPSQPKSNCRIAAKKPQLLPPPVLAAPFAGIKDGLEVGSSVGVELGLIEGLSVIGATVGEDDGRGLGADDGRSTVVGETLKVGLEVCCSPGVAIGLGLGGDDGCSTVAGEVVKVGREGGLVDGLLVLGTTLGEEVGMGIGGGGGPEGGLVDGLLVLGTTLGEEVGLGLGGGGVGEALGISPPSRIQSAGGLDESVQMLDWIQS